MNTQPLLARTSNDLKEKATANIPEINEDEDDIYVAATQPMASTSRSVRTSDEDGNDALLDIDKENIYDQSKQILPTSSTPNVKRGAASIRSPSPQSVTSTSTKSGRPSMTESDEEDIYSAQTQPMKQPPSPSPLTSKSFGLRLLEHKRTSLKRRDRVSPETDEESTAKLIPKEKAEVERLLSAMKEKEGKKPKKVKQKWLFVSSSDEEEDEDEEPKKQTQGKTRSIASQNFQKKTDFCFGISGNQSKKDSAGRAKPAQSAVKNEPRSSDSSDAGATVRPTAGTKRQSAVDISASVEGKPIKSRKMDVVDDVQDADEAQDATAPPTNRTLRKTRSSHRLAEIKESKPTRSSSRPKTTAQKPTKTEPAAAVAKPTRASRRKISASHEEDSDDKKHGKGSSMVETSETDGESSKASGRATRSRKSTRGADLFAMDNKAAIKTKNKNGTEQITEEEATSSRPRKRGISQLTEGEIASEFGTKHFEVQVMIKIAKNETKKPEAVPEPDHSESRDGASSAAPGGKLERGRSNGEGSHRDAADKNNTKESEPEQSIRKPAQAEARGDSSVASVVSVESDRSIGEGSRHVANTSTTVSEMKGNKVISILKMPSFNFSRPTRITPLGVHRDHPN